MRKFLKKSGANGEEAWYLIDKITTEDYSFPVHIYSFFERQSIFIPYSDLLKNYSEVHQLKDDSNSEIIRNQIKTPDGTILTSHHRHDYVKHRDKITNEEYVIDGGTEYIRSSTNIVKPIEQHVYTTDTFEIKREAATWGTYGKNGTEPLTFKKVSEMSNEHLLNAIEFTKAPPKIKDIMKEEFMFRLLYNIKVQD